MFHNSRTTADNLSLAIRTLHIFCSKVVVAVNVYYLAHCVVTSSTGEFLLVASCMRRVQDELPKLPRHPQKKALGKVSIGTIWLRRIPPELFNPKKWTKTCNKHNICKHIIKGITSDNQRVLIITNYYIIYFVRDFKRLLIKIPKENK